MTSEICTKTSSYQAPANYNEIRDIWLACKLGNIRDVQFLLSNNPTLLHENDIHGNSPLYVAAHAGHYNIVQYLCEKGAKDENRRAYLSALNLPIRYLIRMYNPVDDAQTSNKKKNEKTEKNKLSTFVNHFLEVKNKKVDEGMRMGGVIIFKTTHENKTTLLRCHLMFLIARWKNFVQNYLGTTEEQVIQRVKEIQNANVHSDDTRDLIDLGEVNPATVKLLLEYIYTGGLFVDEKQFKNYFDGSGAIHQKRDAFNELHNVCQRFGFEELVSIMDDYLKIVRPDANNVKQKASEYEKATDKYLKSIIQMEIDLQLARIPEPKKIESNNKEIITLQEKMNKLVKENAPSKDILAVQQYMTHLVSDSYRLKESIEKEARRGTVEQMILKWKNSLMFEKQEEIPPIEYDGHIDH